MRCSRFVVLLAAFCLFGISEPRRVVGAEWDDYTPSKELWNITQVKVQPSKIDDYLLGLRKSWVLAMEIGKKNGTVSAYRILVNRTPVADGPNIILLTEYVDWTSANPDQMRDMATRDEFRKSLSEEQEKTLSQEFDKYRSYVGEGDFWAVQYKK
jgi:hypothetical protein